MKYVVFLFLGKSHPDTVSWYAFQDLVTKTGMHNMADNEYILL